MHDDCGSGLDQKLSKEIPSKMRVRKGNGAVHRLDFFLVAADVPCLLINEEGVEPANVEGHHAAR